MANVDPSTFNVHAELRRRFYCENPLVTLSRAAAEAPRMRIPKEFMMMPIGALGRPGGKTMDVRMAMDGKSVGEKVTRPA